MVLIPANICHAQYPNPGDNILNPNLDKFEGTWKFTSGSEEIIVQLKKVNYLSPNNYHYDILMGVHSYKLNGVTIEDYLSNFNAIGQNQDGTIFIGNHPEDGANKIVGTMNDPLKHKQNYISITFIDAVTPQIQWTLHNLSGVHIQKNGEPPFDNSFTLPQTLTLLKQ